MPHGRPRNVPEDLLPRPTTLAEYAVARLRIQLAPGKRESDIKLDDDARAIIDALRAVLDAEARYLPRIPPDKLRQHARAIVRALIESYEI